VLVAAATWVATLAGMPAGASTLLAPAVGAADSATMGTRIADPQTPSAALFENPAGLAEFSTVTHGGSFGMGYGRGRIETRALADYNKTNNVWAAMPDFGMSLPLGDRWHVAAGAYGTTGSRFDFDADPAAGVPAFFSETIVFAAPVGAAYRLTDQVSVGAEVQPMFGQLRTHFPASDLDFRYKINGPGVQGTVGVSLRPGAQWALGLAVRTPGMIWMSGSMLVPGVGRQGVHSDLQMPEQVFLGVTWHGRPRLTLSSSVRFTNSSTLGDSTIKYDITQWANIGFVPDANDEWKFALAAEYAVREASVLRMGVSWASHIVGARGVNPLVFDADDTRIGVGWGQRFGHWVVDGMAGYALPAERRISPRTALVYPGAYSMQGAIVMLGLTHR